MSQPETDPALLRSLHPAPLREEARLRSAGQVLGRDIDLVDVLLSGPEISRRHAWIGHGEAGQWILRDLDSLNGVFVNGQRVDRSHRLAPGDVIGLGRARAPQFEFQSGALNQGQRIRLSGPGPWRLGRDLACEVPIPADLSVSQFHARLERSGDQLRIYDTASRNGLWQGESRVRRQALKLGAQVMLGHQQLTVRALDADAIDIQLRSLGGAIGIAASGLDLDGGGQAVRIDLPAGQVTRLRLASLRQRQMLLRALGSEGPVIAKCFSEPWLDEQPARQRDRIALLGKALVDPPRIGLRAWLEDEALLRIGEPLPPSALKDLIDTTLEALGMVDATDRSLPRLNAMERRLAQIAAALLTRPGLIVIDASSAQLDPAAAARVEERLDRLSGSHLSIVILSEQGDRSPAADDSVASIARTPTLPRAPSLPVIACLLRRRASALGQHPESLLELLLLPVLLILALDLLAEVRSGVTGAMAVMPLSAALATLSLSANRQSLDVIGLRRLGLGLDHALATLLLAGAVLLAQFLLVLALVTWRFPLDIWSLDAGLRVLLAGLAGLALGTMIQSGLPGRSAAALLITIGLSGLQTLWVIAAGPGPLLLAAAACVWGILGLGTGWMRKARRRTG